MIDGLFNFQTNIETCWVSILEDAGITAGKHSDTGTLETPFVAVLYNHKGPTGHRIQLDNGLWRLDGYRGAIAIAISTNRVDNAISHDEFVNNVYALLADWEMLLTHDNCPWYAFVHFEESGVATTYDSENRIDTTDVRYDVVYGIRPTAWRDEPVVIEDES